MSDEMSKKDMAAADTAIAPIIKELVKAWSDVGNEVISSHIEELKDMFPEHVYRIARMTLMNALPHFVNNCCMSVSPDKQMQLTATLACEVLAAALTIDKERIQHEDKLLQSFASVMRGRDDDDETDDNDRSTAEH